jgi:hypothetical protein
MHYERVPESSAECHAHCGLESVQILPKSPVREIDSVSRGHNSLMIPRFMANHIKALLEQLDFSHGDVSTLGNEWAPPGPIRIADSATVI